MGKDGSERIPHYIEGKEPVDQKRWSAVRALSTVISMSIVLIGCTVGLLWALGQDNPEASLSLIFVSAGVLLIVVVSSLTIVFRRLGLQDPKEAMGLPAGSIRAVIALLLIMLFFIAAVFLFNSTRDTVDPTQTRVLDGISTDRFALIPTDEILRSTQKIENGVTVVDVVLYESPQGTTTSDGIAQQLITTLGTLVTAIAAFYFGANSVAAASKAVKDPTSPQTEDGTASHALTPTEQSPATQTNRPTLLSRLWRTKPPA